MASLMSNSSFGKIPSGTTANRPASPVVGDQYYNGTIGALEVYTSSGWKAITISSGGTSGRPASPYNGQLYSNSDLQRLELYTGATYGWQNIVAETPGVTGYSGNIYESTGGTIIITGTNFTTGAGVTLIGNDGTEYIASSVTVSNLTQISAVFGPVSGSKEPYDIKVTNPSNLYGIYYDILSVNDTPVWSTAAGLLGTFNEGSSVSISVSATDEENNALTYSITSGSLPGGLSLNSSTGAITGTVSSVSGDTTYNFTITASDGNNNSSRVFSIAVTELAPVWITSGTISTIINTIAYSYQLNATDDSGVAPTYSIVSGTLPTGISLSSSGLLSGTPSGINSNSNLSMIFRATDANGKYTNQSITIPLSSLVTDLAFGSGSQVSSITSYTGQDGVTRSGGKSGPGTVGYHGVSFNRYFPADKDFELIIKFTKQSDGSSPGEQNHYVGIGLVNGTGFTNSQANNLSFGPGWYGGDVSVFDGITGTKYANYYNSTDSGNDNPPTNSGFPLYIKFIRSGSTFNALWGGSYSSITNQVGQLSLPHSVSGKDIIIALGEASDTEYMFIEKFQISA